MVIPDEITSIEAGAFEGKGLTSVIFSQTLTSIKANAFKDNDLMNLTIPDTLTDIGDNAFTGNSNLEQVYIPNSSASVGTNAFPNGHGVVTNSACFEFDSTNTNQINDYYDNENEDPNDPVCPKDVVLPDHVRTIGNSAFYDKDITSIILNEGLEVIEAYALTTNELTEVIIPDSVVFIGTASFADSHITTVNIGSGIEEIQFDAFSRNVGLTDLCIEALEEDVIISSDILHDFNITYGEPCL